MRITRLLVLTFLAVLALLPGSACAQDQEDPLQVMGRRRVAAADLRLASQWLAYTYQIPARVPQEMLLAGYDYGDTLIALALMGQGASLNEVLQQRQSLRWPEVARQVALDPEELSPALRDLMSFGRNPATPPALRFVPDVRPGLAHRLRLPAFSPTIPDPTAVGRFRLDDEDVGAIRAVLRNPNEVSEDQLRKPGGLTLTTADWLIAATLSKFTPFPLETLLETRVGEVIEWGDVVTIFGMAPTVLTEGPLSSVYPVLTGVPPATVLAAHRRERYPSEVPLRYDLEQLAPSEKLALRPLVASTYRETPAEKAVLDQVDLPLAERAIALALARLSQLDLSVILDRHQSGDSWAAVARRYAIDMTGQDDLWAAIQVREQR